MKRRPVSPRYCNSCKSTTRHTEAESTSTCLRCGTVKQITRVVKALPAGQREEESFWN